MIKEEICHYSPKGVNLMRNIQKLIALVSAVVLLGLCPLAGAIEYEKPYILSVFAGTPLDLSLYEGKALLLHFFTESATNANEEFEKMKALFETYDPDEFQIVLIHVWNTGEDEGATQNVVRDYGLEKMTFFEDRTNAVTDAIHVPSTPFSFFIDKLGYLEDAIMYPVGIEVLEEIVDWMRVSRVQTEEATSAPGGTEPVQTPAGIVIGQPDPDITPSPEPGANAAPAAPVAAPAAPPPGSKGVAQ